MYHGSNKRAIFVPIEVFVKPAPSKARLQCGDDAVGFTASTRNFGVTEPI